MREPPRATEPPRGPDPPRRPGPAARDRRPRPARELRAFLERELGEPCVTVEAEGPEQEIAAVGAPASLLPRILDPGFRERLVERARSLGYRYAAVDVSEDPVPDPGEPADGRKPADAGGV